MNYQILKEKPPHWDKLLEKFPNADEKTVAVTYGDKIYCQCDMSEDLLTHELVHVQQQTKMGRDIWWDEYMKNPLFVYEQELEAYREQYAFFVKKYAGDRNRLFRIKYAIAKILSGPLYNNAKTHSEVMKELE